MWLYLIQQPWTLAGRPKGHQHIGLGDICRAGIQIKVVNQTLYLLFLEPFNDTLKGLVFLWVFGFAKAGNFEGHVLYIDFVVSAESFQDL